MRRSTKRETSFDAARFEVPAQKWARICDGDYSVAVLNDCKYGYDVKDDTIRITLIKSSTSPDPQADQGVNLFTYNLLAHAAADRQMLDREAYALNTSVRFLDGGGQTSAQTFAKCNLPNVIIETIKPAEDGEGVVVRLFHAFGEGAEAQISFNRSIAYAVTTGLDERPIEPVHHDGQDVRLSFRPYEIVTLLVKFV